MYRIYQFLWIFYNFIQFYTALAGRRACPWALLPTRPSARSIPDIHESFQPLRLQKNPWLFPCVSTVQFFQIKRYFVCNRHRIKAKPIIVALFRRRVAETLHPNTGSSVSGPSKRDVFFGTDDRRVAYGEDWLLVFAGLLTKYVQGGGWDYSRGNASFFENFGSSDHMVKLGTTTDECHISSKSLADHVGPFRCIYAAGRWHRAYRITSNRNQRRRVSFAKGIFVSTDKFFPVDLIISILCGSTWQVVWLSNLKPHLRITGSNIGQIWHRPIQRV